MPHIKNEIFFDNDILAIVTGPLETLTWSIEPRNKQKSFLNPSLISTNLQLSVADTVHTLSKCLGYFRKES